MINWTSNCTQLYVGWGGVICSGVGERGGFGHIHSNVMAVCICRMPSIWVGCNWNICKLMTIITHNWILKSYSRALQWIAVESRWLNTVARLLPRWNTISVCILHTHLPTFNSLIIDNCESESLTRSKQCQDYSWVNFSYNLLYILRQSAASLSCTCCTTNLLCLVCITYSLYEWICILSVFSKLIDLYVKINYMYSEFPGIATCRMY